MPEVADVALQFRKCDILLEEPAVPVKTSASAHRNSAASYRRCDLSRRCGWTSPTRVQVGSGADSLPGTVHVERTSASTHLFSVSGLTSHPARRRAP